MEQLEVNDAVTAERTHDTRTVALWPVLRLARHRLVTGALAPASGAAGHRMARLSVLLTLGLLTVALAGCTSPAGTPSPTHTATWSLAALGDSIPAGSACDCTPYPQLSASDLSLPGGPAVTASNEAVGGFTSFDVLHQLSSTTAELDPVKAARLVEIEVGANDVAPSSSCGTDVSCYQPKVTDLRANLHDIVNRVQELAAGHAVRVVLLDYWSVWLGGQYAHEQGQAYEDAAAGVTGEVNTVIRDVAAQTRSAYVDLRAAFKGPDYAYDETHYLATDGIHPNASGHQRIAAALAEVAPDAAQKRMQPSGLLHAAQEPRNSEDALSELNAEHQGPRSNERIMPAEVHPAPDRPGAPTS